MSQAGTGRTLLPGHLHIPGIYVSWVGMLHAICFWHAAHCCLVMVRFTMTRHVCVCVSLLGATHEVCSWHAQHNCQIHQASEWQCTSSSCVEQRPPPLCILSSAQLSSAQLSSAQLSSAQALCQAIPVMTSSVWIDNIHMFHLDLGKFGNASKALMCWLSLASCRSPIRRISEVMLLVFVTSSLWFLVAYASRSASANNPTSTANNPRSSANNT